MEDVLLLSERIQQTIELGESQFREFKSAWEGPPLEKKPRERKSVSKDIAETLVAFANADGGELLIGVEDDKIITGIKYSDETINKLLEVTRTGVLQETPLRSPIAKRVKLGDKEVLYFAVEKSTTTIHQTSEGRCLQRKDLENVPVSAITLQFERQEQLSREYDRGFVDGAQVTDLNVEIVRSVAEHISKMSPEKCLQYLGLAEFGRSALQLRRAAVLLFAKDVTRWHPRCQVRIVRVPGTELKTGKDYRVTTDALATGNILEVVTAAWEKLRPHLVETKLSSDALFKERVMYPEDACREALVNAITHRDYSLEGQGIEILIYDDRMEIISPGGLLSNIKIDALKKLEGVHESRNAFVARVLREIGYVREMGEGMRRIFRLMQDADLVAPEIRSEPNRFTIILRHRSVFSDGDQRWLDGYKPLKLTRQEALIALLGKDGELVSPQQIYDRLELVDWDMYRVIIDKIQTKGVIYNAISRQEKVKQARKLQASQRTVPRLAVRQPNELEQGLSVLFSVLKKQGQVSQVNKVFVAAVLEALPQDNPYRTDSLHLFKLLRLLGLIDDDRHPTLLLQRLWAQPPEEPTAPAPKVEAPAVIHPPRKRPVLPAAAPNTGKALFVGNLDYDTTPDELAHLFAQYGRVVRVSIPRDLVTQRGRGFGFVYLATDAQSVLAISELDGVNLRGRSLRVNWAR